MKKKNSIRIILILLTVLMLIFTIYKITSIYGLFYSQLSGTANLNLGKWNIHVNTEEISSGITQEFTINNLNVVQSTSTKIGKFAPGMTGYFEITIDATNTDVSAKYDLMIDTSDITNNQMQISSVTETVNNNTITETATNTYTGVIQVNGNKINTIRINFSWINLEANNENDTQLGTTPNLTLEVPVTVSVSQYLGEPIIRHIK